MKEARVEEAPIIVKGRERTVGRRRRERRRILSMVKIDVSAQF